MPLSKRVGVDGGVLGRRRPLAVCRGAVERCLADDGGMSLQGLDPDEYPPIDPGEPAPDDAGELLPDTPDELPDAPVEPLPDDGEEGGVREPA